MGRQSEPSNKSLMFWEYMSKSSFRVFIFNLRSDDTPKSAYTILGDTYICIYIIIKQHKQNKYKLGHIQGVSKKR